MSYSFNPTGLGIPALKLPDVFFFFRFERTSLWPRHKLFMREGDYGASCPLRIRAGDVHIDRVRPTKQALAIDRIIMAASFVRFAFTSLLSVVRVLSA